MLLLYSEVLYACLRNKVARPTYFQRKLGLVIGSILLLASSSTSMLQLWDLTGLSLDHVLANEVGSSYSYHSGILFKKNDRKRKKNTSIVWMLFGRAPGTNIACVSLGAQLGKVVAATSNGKAGTGDRVNSSTRRFSNHCSGAQKWNDAKLPFLHKSPRLKMATENEGGEQWLEFFTIHTSTYNRMIL